MLKNLVVGKLVGIFFYHSYIKLSFIKEIMDDGPIHFYNGDFHENVIWSRVTKDITKLELSLLNT